MLWRSIGLNGAVGVVLATLVTGLAALLAWRWGSVLGELARGLAALGAAKAVRPIRSRASGPVGRLARQFDEVAPQVQDRLAHLDQDLQQLQAVLTGMAEGVIAVDARRRLLFANESAQRLFGLDANSVGRLVAELIRNPQVQEATDNALDGPAPFRGEIALASREPFS